MDEQEFDMEVIIQESPGGNWNIYADGCKVDDGFFRRASDAQEYCNQNGWLITDIRKHEQPRKITEEGREITMRPRDGLYYDPPTQ